MDGVIVVDKPAGWTSHDAVNRMRRLASTKKVGHLGTLDPLATGVLPLVIGRATRLAQFFLHGDKVYEGVVRFGFSTDTYDRDGTPTSEAVEPHLEIESLERHLAAFRGTFLQAPPPVSAKKVAGTPAYRLVRRQIPVELAPVEVTVHSLELLSLDPASIAVRVRCTAGTYLRAIAHDLGQALGCGAYLESLRRIAAGDFVIDQAHTLPDLDALAGEGRLAEALIPCVDLLPAFPVEMVDAITAGQIRQGRDFRVSPFRVRQGTRYVKAVSPDGELLAIGEARLPNLYHPMLVL
jgi:tRNA pseudouridine55 synthase